MPHDRFFSEESLRVHQTITLSGSELHHLQHVMRKKTNDLVEMINGRGELAKAKVHCPYLNVTPTTGGVGVLTTFLKGKNPTIARRPPQHDHQREYAT